MAVPSKRVTGIVMFNLGGPSTTNDVYPFLLRLFSDREIIQLPAQPLLAKYIAVTRTPKVQKHYQEIGGGSPILKWTKTQGEQMIAKLDQLSPETAPHKYYIAFRYINPLTEETLRQMKEDGVTRAVGFTQYPQFSCSTTGSSFNELWRQTKALNFEKEFQWSLIDRWYQHPRLIQSFVERVIDALNKLTPEDRAKAVLIFSAHSIPTARVDKGDAYPQECSATVAKVVDELRSRGYNNKYVLAYQSQVGPRPWLGPKTPDVITGLSRKGFKHQIIIPIAFTSDHIETLFEIDIEFKEIAEKSGVKNFIRAESLNDSDTFSTALAEVVSSHLKSKELHSPQYKLNCCGCINPGLCRSLWNPAYQE
eukprot:TRINITY_DN4580_c0_g1_i1.p1 TRINITY_DN4580_c0_g1~~TRINITY_DN4580_c0_g1_i1.p1  ORF type:complete len:376 (-),score=94.27 TRINITY_DN4580_c0_g1_i1:63-1157(-)